MEYKRERLGDLLVSLGKVTRAQLNEALALQVRSGGKIGEVLVRELILTEDQIAAVLAEQKGYEHISLTTYPFDRTATVLIPERMARKNQVIPIAFEGDRLILAMADPLDVEAVDNVEVRTGFKVIPVVASVSQITNAIEKYIATGDAFQDVVNLAGEPDAEDGGGIEGITAIGAEEMPVVRLVNQLIREAVHDRASDIHIEPQPRCVVVRYRVDGVLQKVMELPASARAGVTSCVKIMAEMDIAERRRPQDGRIAVRVDGRTVDIRVAVLPTLDGEALTLRILNSDVSFLSLDDVGLTDGNRKIFDSFIRRPYGAILVAGPTGSGKSTTMYAALNILNKPESKIVTVEDPVEYQMAGITQVSIKPKIGLTFAAGLRTILRSDPDIVMVGEIRDAETAEIAVRSALTGHLVLSSIHTNDAPSALSRLSDMGIPPYITSSGLLGVIAQRLARRLCPSCRKQLKIPESRLLAAGFTADEIKGLKLYAPVGCGECVGTGYSGRIGLFEIMPLNEEIVQAFLNHASAEELRKLALAAGMAPLRRDALDKVAAGITSLEEIDRVVV